MDNLSRLNEMSPLLAPPIALSQILRYSGPDEDHTRKELTALSDKAPRNLLVEGVLSKQVMRVELTTFIGNSLSKSIYQVSDRRHA